MPMRMDFYGGGHGGFAVTRPESARKIGTNPRNPAI
jgi:hypothetical protein